MAHVIALDQGTTSSRAIVFDENAKAIATVQREFQQIYPKSGWVEHDPAEIWSTQAGVMTEAISKAHIRPRDIAAIGITNQRETTVVWDRETGQPICNAIVWQDRRTAGICDKLKADGLADTFNQKTGLLIDAYFSGTKIKWILDNVDGARAKAEQGKLAFGTVDSWLINKLTSGHMHVTDVTNASRTLLYNIHTHDWDDELLEIMGVPRSMMPEVKDSSAVYGDVTTSLVGEGVPIAGVAGDQQAALVGQLCTSPGMSKNTYGTGCFLLMNTGDKPQASKNNLVTTVAWRESGKPAEYALEGGVFIGGAVVQWLRDGLGIIESAPECDKLAETVPDAGGCVLVPAFVGLGAPHWDQYARGAMVGISRGTTAAHLCRAALEGIAYSVADLATAMSADAGQPMSELRVDGGASNSNILLQIQADLLQTPVVRPKYVETTALGAAYLAGLATGVFKSFDQLSELWQEDRRFEPKISDSESKSRMARWHDAVERAKNWEPKEA